MATKKSNLKPVVIDWFCRKCWRHGVVAVSAVATVMKSPALYAADDHRATTPPFGVACGSESITWRVRPPVEKKPKHAPPPPDDTYGVRKY